ncbi:hypothetical protein VTO42DRAFT_6878 [Malbranchea cinnamomea]
MRVVPRRYAAALQPHVRRCKKLVLMIVHIVSQWLKRGFGRILLSTFRKFLKLLSFIKIVIASFRNLFRLLSRKNDPPTTPTATIGHVQLPAATSPRLHLDHPTDEESIAIWMLTASSWRYALSIPQYLEKSSYLMTVPLAKDGGLTQWILVDKTLPPNQRPIPASCETLRKRALVSDVHGNVTEAIAHGVASVYCDPKYRRRGYASRLLRELRDVLPVWQADQSKRVVASILFSDIGKEFYAAVGWRPFPSFHLEFDAAALVATGASHVFAEQVGELCKEDEAISRRAMACPYSRRKTRFMILPDHDHMLWHHRREEFVCEKLLGKQPHVKGAIAGSPGNRVWALWSHCFSGTPPDQRSSQNTLHILRLVLENEVSLEHALQAGNLFEENELVPPPPVEELKAVLQAAQSEAAEWKLQHVELWAPSPLLERLIQETGIQHRKRDRSQTGICSLQWYGDANGQSDGLDWIGNGKYHWC